MQYAKWKKYLFEFINFVSLKTCPENCSWLFMMLIADSWLQLQGEK